MFKFKKTAIILAALTVLLIGCVIICDKIIDSATNDFVFDEIDNVPYNKVGLVLGTS